MKGDVGRLVLTHKDRLLRFGSELVFAMCEEFETEVIIINKSSEELSFEQELVTDMIELITVFSARLYGSRSRALLVISHELLVFDSALLMRLNNKSTNYF